MLSDQPKSTSFAKIKLICCLCCIVYVCWQEQPNMLDLCRDAIGQCRDVLMRTYIVWECSRTSQRAQALQKYNLYAAYSTLHSVCTVCSQMGCSFAEMQ